MSGHKNARIEHDKFVQIAHNLNAKIEENRTLRWENNELKQLVEQDMKSLKMCWSDFRWLITIALILGASLGWATRGML